MTDIYTFSNYKEFVRVWVRAQPKKGHGQFRRMAEHLGVGTVLMSQVFNGERDLNEEQALELCGFLNLLEGESRYFLALVRHARAGSKKLRDHIRMELDQIRKGAENLKGRIKSEKDISENSKAIFYSDWIYSAIRLATDVPKFREVNGLSRRFDLPSERVRAAAEFLVQNGLCVLEQGELRMGPQIVFLPADSPYVLSRQRSWRLRAFQKMEEGRAEDLYFTCPIVCSEKTIASLRKKILKFIEETLAEVKDSPSEELVCMNIDWFRI